MYIAYTFNCKAKSSLESKHHVHIIQGRRKHGHFIRPPVPSLLTALSLSYRNAMFLVLNNHVCCFLHHLGHLHALI